MTIKELCISSGSALLILLSLIQISPIKINPWSAILCWFGKQINKDLSDNLNSVKENIQALQTDIDTIRDESREIHAKDCRVRILRFADEIYLQQPHSQEHYKQILTDVTHYEKYCNDHPLFENQIAVAAIEIIKESYNKHLHDRDFLI